MRSCIELAFRQPVNTTLMHQAGLWLSFRQKRVVPHAPSKSRINLIRILATQSWSQCAGTKDTTECFWGRSRPKCSLEGKGKFRLSMVSRRRTEKLPWNSRRYGSRFLECAGRDLHRPVIVARYEKEDRFEIESRMSSYLHCISLYQPRLRCLRLCPP